MYKQQDQVGFPYAAAAEIGWFMIGEMIIWSKNWNASECCGCDMHPRPCAVLCTDNIGAMFGCQIEYYMVNCVYTRGGTTGDVHRI